MFFWKVDKYDADERFVSSLTLTVSAEEMLGVAGFNWVTCCVCMCVFVFDWRGWACSCT